MLFKVFCLYDSAADSFQTPFFQPSLGVVNRTLTDEVQSGDSQLSKHPSDFSLFELGSFSMMDGCFSLHDEPKRMYSLDELIGS